MENPTTYVIAGAAIVIAAQAWSAWRTRIVLARVARFEDRLAHVCDALSLLSETTEAGLKSVAGEVERLRGGDEPVSGSRRTTRRMASAARRGRTVQEIAAEEAVSEGEVRLRIHLAEGQPVGGGEQDTAAERGRKGQAAAAPLVPGPARPRNRRVKPSNGVEVAAGTATAAPVTP
jgi:hypothetical protein